MKSKRRRPLLEDLITRYVLSTVLVTVVAIIALTVIPRQVSAAPGEDVKCTTYVPELDTDDAHLMTLMGVACFEEGRYEWALVHYRRAYALSSDPFLLGAIGRSLHELGLYEPALAYYQKYLALEETPSGADRIRRRVDELQELLAEDENVTVVELKSNPSGAAAHVVLDNGEWYYLDETPTAVQLRPGSYEFAFHGPGMRPTKQKLRVRDTETVQVEAELVSEDALFSVSTRKRRRAGFWLFAGSTAVTLSGLTMLGLSVHQSSAARQLDDHFDDLDDYDERRRHHLDRADTLWTWGIVTTIVGTAGLLTGSLLYALSGPSPVQSDGDESNSHRLDARWQAEPVIGADHLGIRIRF